jgi:hypothetical protein
MPSLFLLMIDVGRQNFATFPPRPGVRPEHPVNMPGGFRQRIHFLLHHANLSSSLLTPCNTCLSSISNCWT